MDTQAFAEQITRESGITFRKLSVLTLHRDMPEGQWVTLLVFRNRAATPSLVIKAADQPGLGTRIRHEAETLETLHRSGSPRFKESIPALLFHGTVDGFQVMAQTALPGVVMKSFSPDSYFPSARFRTHLLWVGEWLDIFRTAFPEEGAPGSPHAAIEAYRSAFDRSEAAEALLSQTVDRLEKSPVRLTPRHGDFCTANLLVSDDPPGLSVIDWEAPATPGWPLSDLLHFLSSTWCIPFAKGQAAKVENYRRMLRGDHTLNEVYWEMISSSVKAQGMNPDLVRSVAAMVWVTYANEKKAGLERMDPPVEPERYLPLIFFEKNRCLNLELLAEVPSGSLFG
jgi:hypothetical protein